MSKRILTYISLLIICAVSLTSCADNDLGGMSSGLGELREFKGTITLNLSTPDVAVRSRSLNTQAGASVLIRNLWVGVFNTTTGECFGAAKYEDMNQSLQSGVVFNKLINVNFVAYDEKLPLAYIVAVANYDGVTTWDGQSVGDILPTYDERSSITWDDIINLDIDTDSAYSGNKGEDENSNAPFLAGFFQDATTLTQNPKIDQFAYEVLGPSAIYPSVAADGMDIQLGDDNDDKIYVAAGAICLRRLVSHNIIRLNLSNGYEVTDAQYKRFNMPRVVYMLQRRTDTNRYSSFEEWQDNSPNRADHLLKNGEYDTNGPTFPYSSDHDWIPLEINSWDDRTNVEFFFDHFENKHWGFGDLRSQDDREARNPDGTFKALCAGPEDAYNNFASYFVLKMHIINKATGESADVEYTLHEGFCNTDDGRRAETLEEKCHDFCSFRNVNYTYNINISGINDIKTTVIGQEGQEVAHPNGQSGTIWKMNYATGPSRKPIPIEGGTFNYSGNYVSFSNKPDVGFRIYGRDDKGEPVDICYNMPEDMFEGFSGLWPGGSPMYVEKTDRNLGIPESLLKGMLIGNATSGYYNIVDFVNGIESGSISPIGKYDTKFTSYDGNIIGLKGNFMRGIYIFDRNDTHNATDRDGCSSYNIAYGAEQYPFKFEALTFDEKNIVWDNTYYKSVTNVENLFVATTPIFYGAENSVIDLRWKHDERFIGYRISVYNSKYTHPAIMVTPKTLSQYLHDINGEKLFIYPLNTASFPRNASNGATNYSFSVTPIVDQDVYEAGEPTHIEYNADGKDATCIRVCSTLWDISSTTDWETVYLRNLKGGSEIHYRGLTLYTYRDITDYGVKGSLICFGGAGSTTDRYFSFTASVPGKIAVTCRSHSGSTDEKRQLLISRMTGEDSYEQLYSSGTMAGSKTTYTTGVLPLNDNGPTVYRIYAAGSIDYYKIQFTPAN